MGSVVHEDEPMDADPDGAKRRRLSGPPGSHSTATREGSSDRTRRRRRGSEASPGLHGGEPVFEDRVWLNRVLLAGTVLLLVLVPALTPGEPREVRPVGLADIQNRRYLLGWLGDVALSLALQTLRFVPVGFFAVQSFRWCRDTVRRQLYVSIPALGLAGTLAALVRGFDYGSPWRWPGSLLLIAPMVGVSFGVWLGAAWRRGWEARLRLVPRLALGLAGSGVLAFTLLLLAAERKPLEIDVPRIPVAEKRRLHALFEDKDPRHLKPGSTATLRLGQGDLDQLFAWANALNGDAERRARVELSEDHVVFEGTIGLPIMRTSRRFINLRAGGEVAIDDSHPYLRWTTLTVGRIAVPSPVLRAVSPLVLHFVRDDPRASVLLKPVSRLRIHQDAVEMTYGPMKLPRGFVSELFRAQGTDPDLAPAVAAQLEQLITRSALFPHGDLRFAAAMETAFALARRRSIYGNVVTENKGAILALGILLGHWRIQQPIGKLLEEGELKQGLRAFHGTTLRGRPDWTRHFTVSAAVVVLSSEGISSAAGVLKEELDAMGGSGFSFGDLLADRAGTVFATLAIRDESSAQAIQESVSGGFQADDFFPAAEGLPEGIQDTELQSDYGGVGGERYRTMIDEIERRVTSCAAYRRLLAPAGVDGG